MLRRLALAVAALVISLMAAAQNPERHCLLVLDSYGEENQWNREAVPALMKIAAETGAKVRIEHLDGEHIDSDTVYYKRANSLMNSIITKPDAVFFIGNLAFNLRDEIESRWPGIPMILMAEEDFVAPLSHYLGVSSPAAPDSLKVPLDSLRSSYNFTYVDVPYPYERTIDLMSEMLPELQDVVFISDNYYINRAVNGIFQRYIEENYPDIDYKHIVSTVENKDTLLRVVTGYDPRRGLIFSSGIYGTIAPFSHPQVSVTDIGTVYDIDYAFFTFREPLIHTGEFLAGWVYDPKEMTDILYSELLDILNGRPASDIPFTAPEGAYPLVDFDCLQKTDIPKSRVPDDAHWINEPLPIWEAYRNLILNVGVVATAILGCILVYLVLHRRRLRLLKHHEELLRNMPLAYSGAEVIYNSVTGMPSSVRFVDQNEKFRRLMVSADTAESAEGVVHSDNPFLRERVLKLCHSVVTTRKTLEFAQYFNFNNSFYEFILAPSAESNRIDIFGLDITSHHRDAEKLRDSNKMLQLILNSSRLVSWVLDVPRGRILFDFNNYKSFSKFFTYLMNRGLEITTEEWIANIHPDDLRRFKDAYRRLTEGLDKIMRVEYRLVYEHEGQTQIEWVEVNAAVSRYDAKGIPVTIVGSSSVITEGKQVQHDRDVKAERNRVRSTFLTNMVNELRTPVNAIINLAGEMRDTDDAYIRRLIYPEIASRGQLLLKLYNDVIMLTFLDEGINEFNFSMVNVNNLMQTIEETTRAHLQPGVKLTMNLGMDKCQSLMATHTTDLVMSNLLLNACKYTHQGRITFGYELRGSMLYFYVADTGHGISPQSLPHVFDRFSSSGRGLDTGLGMAICKSIVEKIGGEIGIESEGIGKGAKAWFTIPYIPEGDSPMSRSEVPRLLNAKRRTILVAEPTESDFILLKYILREHYDLLHAVDGQQAIDLYIQHKPDMVILAINLPKKDGFEVLRTLRDAAQAVPILAISTFAFKAENMREMGFTNFISKTDSTEQILQKVRQAFTSTSKC